MPTANNQPKREDLPVTLFPRRGFSLREVKGGEEINILISTPETILPLPEGIDPKKAKRLSGLAQYKGRSEEGRKKSLGNLKRSIPVMAEDQLPAKSESHLPAPVVPTAFPPAAGPESYEGRALAACNSQEEYDLYVETWNEWLKGHVNDYCYLDADGKLQIYPEDKDDVHRICIEKVKQFRMDMLSKQKPWFDCSAAYNQSVRRGQVARDNLLASRNARMGGKNKGGGKNTTINIAVASGQVDLFKRKEVADQTESDDFKFLESTSKDSNKDVIDAEVEDDGSAST